MQFFSKCFIESSMEKKETLKGFIFFSNCSALKTMMLIDDTKE